MAVETAALDHVGTVVELGPAQLALVLGHPRDSRRFHLVALAARLGERRDDLFEGGDLLFAQALVAALEGEKELALIERSKRPLHLPFQPLEQVTDSRQLGLDLGLVIELAGDLLPALLENVANLELVTTDLVRVRGLE